MLSRYYHTLRYLRPVQIVGRLHQKLYRPRPDIRSSPPLRRADGSWRVPCQREQTMLEANRFCFLNDERHLSFPEAWNAPEYPKLWLYNLHYFDDLNAIDAQCRLDWHEGLIRRWVIENPPAQGYGWDAYPTSLRIVNWIKWSLSGNSLAPEAIHSLAVQARYLRCRLEFHLLGNHLFENAKALVFAGLFFVGEEAERWQRTGSRLLLRQIQEQLLADGGHFELSPMYHALILEGVMDLVNLYRTFRIEPPEEWDETIGRMLEWLRIMCHPDGGIAFFNDAAFGVAPTLEALEKYAVRLEIGSESKRSGTRLLEASGYARLEEGDAVLIADVAAIGPDYLPGHAHADSLSFELSLCGRRVMVNSGTSVYGDGAERQRQRGTAAHNTARLDGLDSSEVWSAFRVARRARVRVEAYDTEPMKQLVASHDGYRRLPGGPVHRRSWGMQDKGLVLTDRLEGGGQHQVDIFFHFHPSLDIVHTAEGGFSVLNEDGTVLLTIHTAMEMTWEILPGHWHPEFGVGIVNTYLRGSHHGVLPKSFETIFAW